MTRKEQKAETRQKIIEAARTLFRHNGYGEVNMRAVAKSIGMSTGALYAQFADKAAMFEAAMGEPPPDVIAFLEQVAATCGESKSQALINLAQEAVRQRKHLMGGHA